MRFLAPAYGLLLVYGTLFPLAGWSTPAVNIWDALLAGGVGHRSAPDIVTNILVYIPFGLFFYGAIAGRLRGFPAVCVVSLIGTALSFSLESLQAYLPGRVPSILEVALNAGGTLLGVLFACVFQPSGKVGRLFLTLRQLYVAPGGLPNLGLVVLGIWALSQLSPLVPSIDLSNLAHGLKPLSQAFKGQSALNTAHATVYFFAVTGISLIFHDVIRPGKRKILFLGFLSAVLMLKIPVVSRQLSFEAIVGSGSAFLVYLTVSGMPRLTRLKIAAIAIAGAVIVEGLRMEPGTPVWDVRAFNWIPFKTHLNNTLIGFADILAGLWPFVAMSSIAMRIMGEHLRSVSVVGGLLVFFGMFLLEWNQQNVPGRHADITDAILAWVAWFVPWHLPQLTGTGDEHGFNNSNPRVANTSLRSDFSFKNISRPIVVRTIALISLGLLAFLTDDKFIEVPLDESARQRLPNAHYFNRVGLIVGRSDWSPDATYVTFKAGDNFWSHSHLDQGAFTIYKGGALAIDSGLYGPSYGADHHLNYSYQSIAHNLVTITDPDDIIPIPQEDEPPRPIANDGGQRRVGSGWGIEAAPLDLKEWRGKKEIYHTATMNNVFLQDNLVVAIADLTPAYTNAHSGIKSFSHRTRRVEKFVRTFGENQQDDVIVIFDRVTSTDPSFFKRWHLHTLYTPRKTIDGFVATVSPQNRVGHHGGRLQGHVLLPKQAHIQLTGGPGFEFYVEGKNYALDKHMVKRRINKRGAEPGSWRIEVSPAFENTEDVFLVVLLPPLGEGIPIHKVRLLEEAGRIGCEIVGPSRLTRWWFDQNPEKGQGLTIEVTDGIGSSRNHRIGNYSDYPVDRGSE